MVVTGSVLGFRGLDIYVHILSKMEQEVQLILVFQIKILELKMC